MGREIVKSMKKGTYIVFEGIVGSGKTTQSKLLVKRLKKEFPDRDVVWTREPGGSEIAGVIRKIVQGTEFEEEMDPICEAYLYASARAQSLRKVVLPVIERGGIVVSDRSYLTSIAYQGAGRGLAYELIMEINKIAVDGINPDKVFFISLDPKTSLSRTRDKAGDKFEKLDVDFFKKALAGYEFAQKKLAGVWENVDGSGSVEKIHEEIFVKTKKIII